MQRAYEEMMIKKSVKQAYKYAVGRMQAIKIGAETKTSNFLSYCLLIAIWFWSFGFGMFNGMTKKVK